MGADREADAIALAIEVEGDGQALRSVAEVVADAGARITWISILDARSDVETILVELADAHDTRKVVEPLRSLECVRQVSEKHTLHHIFGKRIVIIGGGAQVGQVLLPHPAFDAFCLQQFLGGF